ncbi:hypothetical protein CEUSTIGMA_g6173.t1 [Chlamydomonas eustigma]|uniref:Guanylate cyclase domain-containing protein n=1 Tax=Chlamydomonas eustigma TaxID=1157962 RepID=A0A250X6R8_9CHLO|nr:hypothetical protein CEUSTIGMA_g6173.t1 [Chlamydomonas eustigma]|eukprot:GAX78736.1 hypothetical protein CEUSTIGMA_g6173.t1 [Chlamydomonas eustigma]
MLLFAGQVEGGKHYAAWHRKDALELSRELAAVMRSILRQISGSYFVRQQDGDLKYMTTFAHAEDALYFCTTVQECVMYIDWPDSALKTWPTVRGEARQLLFRGPRLKMGVCEGVPSSIMPDHMGRADYHGACINQAARFMDAAAHGGQVACDEVLAQGVFKNWADLVIDEPVEDVVALIKQTNAMDHPQPEGLIDEDMTENTHQALNKSGNSRKQNEDQLELIQSTDPFSAVMYDSLAAHSTSSMERSTAGINSVSARTMVLARGITSAGGDVSGITAHSSEGQAISTGQLEITPATTSPFASASGTLMSYSNLPEASSILHYGHPASIMSKAAHRPLAMRPDLERDNLYTSLMTQGEAKSILAQPSSSSMVRAGSLLVQADAYRALVSRDMSSNTTNSSRNGSSALTALTARPSDISVATYERSRSSSVILPSTVEEVRCLVSIPKAIAESVEEDCGQVRPASHVETVEVIEHSVAVATTSQNIGDSFSPPAAAKKCYAQHGLSLERALSSAQLPVSVAEDEIMDLSRTDAIHQHHSTEVHVQADQDLLCTATASNNHEAAAAAAAAYSNGLIRQSSQASSSSRGADLLKLYTGSPSRQLSVSSEEYRDSHPISSEPDVPDANPITLWRILSMAESNNGADSIRGIPAEGLGSAPRSSAVLLQGTDLQEGEATLLPSRQQHLSHLGSQRDVTPSSHPHPHPHPSHHHGALLPGSMMTTLETIEEGSSSSSLATASRLWGSKALYWPAADMSVESNARQSGSRRSQAAVDTVLEEEQSSTTGHDLEAGSGIQLGRDSYGRLWQAKAISCPTTNAESKRTTVVGTSNGTTVGTSNGRDSRVSVLGSLQASTFGANSSHHPGILYGSRKGPEGASKVASRKSPSEQLVTDTPAGGSGAGSGGKGASKQHGLQGPPPSITPGDLWRWKVPVERIIPGQWVDIEAHRLGDFRFKGSSDIISMVNVLPKWLSDRQYPQEMPAGKGDRVLQLSGIFCTATVPLLRVISIYREQYESVLASDEEEAALADAPSTHHPSSQQLPPAYNYDDASVAVRALRHGLSAVRHAMTRRIPTSQDPSSSTGMHGGSMFGDSTSKGSNKTQYRGSVDNSEHKMMPGGDISTSPRKGSARRGSSGRALATARAVEAAIMEVDRSVRHRGATGATNSRAAFELEHRVKFKPQRSAKSVV